MPRYSADIKVQAITLMSEGMSRPAVKRHLRSSVHVDTLTKWKQLYESTLAVVRSASDYEKRGRPLTFSDEEREFMADLISADPTLYLDEVQELVYNETGLHTNLSTISDDLIDRLNLTRKKVITVHPAQSPVKRAAYIYSIANLDADMLVFADESAVAAREVYRQYGRAIRGYRTTPQKQTRAGIRYSLLPAVCLDGLLAVSCQEGSYLRDDFEDFLEFNLLPKMNPYPSPNSVLIIDNARIHHGGRIEDLCEERGIRLIYLPPYSPDFNPIEKAFSALKAYFRRTQFLQGLMPEEMIEAIEEAVQFIFTRELMVPLYNSSWLL